MKPVVSLTPAGQRGVVPCGTTVTSSVPYVVVIADVPGFRPVTVACTKLPLVVSGDNDTTAGSDDVIAGGFEYETPKMFAFAPGVRNAASIAM